MQLDCRLCVGGFLLCVLISNTARARTRTWVGGSDDWSNPQNWSASSPAGATGVPTSGDFVYLTATDGQARAINYDVDGSGTSLGQLTIGGLISSADDSTMSLSLAGNTLTSSFVSIGESSGAGKNVGASGEIDQSDGANNTGAVWLGTNAKDVGTYNISGGNVQTYTLYVGASGTGSVAHSGGNITVSSLFVLGASEGGKGIYELSGSQATITIHEEEIGLLGTGTFNQSAGTHTIAGGLSIADEDRAPSYYNLSGGTLTIGRILAVGSGQFNQTGGTLTLGTSPTGHNLIVESYSGQADYTLDHPQAVLKVRGGIYIGGNDANAAGRGTAHFLNGSATTGTLKAWNNGTITWAGGSLSVTSLSLVGGGKMFLTAGHAKVLNVKYLSIDSVSQLDLSDNNMVIDYTGAVGSQLNDLRGLMKNGAIRSSSSDAIHRLGYADNNTLGAAQKTTFTNVDVDPSSVLIKYTFAGDADLSGNVDVADFARFFAGFGSSNTTWQNGDFDYNGSVDVADFTLFFRAFGQSGLAPTPEMIPFMSLENVPEPAALCLCAIVGTFHFMALRKNRAPN